MVPLIEAVMSRPSSGAGGLLESGDRKKLCEMGYNENCNNVDFTADLSP